MCSVNLMRRAIVGLLVLLFLLVLPNLSFAFEVEHAELLEDGDSIALSEIAWVLEEPAQGLTIEELRAPIWRDKFEKRPKGLEFGYTSSAYWIRFAIKNTRSRDAVYYLDSPNALVDSMLIFQLNGEKVLRTAMGDSLPYGARKIDSVSFSHRIEVPARSASHFFIRVHSQSSLSLPYVLFRERAYVEHLHDRMLLLGSYYGIFLGLFSYNFFLFVVTRERVYGYYLIFLFFNFTFSSALDGVSYRLAPKWVYWQSIAPYVSLGMASACALRFAACYLNAEHTLPRMYRVFPWFERFFLALALAVALFPGKTLFVATIFSINIGLGLVAASALIRLKRGDTAAKAFALAWVVMVLSIIFGLFTATGLLPLHEYLPHFHKAGMACEMTLLSMALAHKINVLKNDKEQAAQEAAQATAAAKAKSDFLAKMSHEIRTPMNGVLGMTELLGQSELSAHQESCVRTIDSSGKALLSVINDILDYSKIEAGKMEIESTTVDLAQLMDECASIFALQSYDQGVKLFVRVDPSCPDAVMGDPLRLRQVIVNLLSNAFKFTSEGSVQLELRPVQDVKPACEQVQARNGGPALPSCSLCLSVKDSGIGISQEGVTRLFRPFSQEDSTITRRYGGTGLGLTICRQLVELMGGEIGVESEVGKGSRFWLRLDMPIAESLEVVESLEIARSASGVRGIQLGHKSEESAHLAEQLRDLGAQMQRVRSVGELERALRETPSPDFLVFCEAALTAEGLDSSSLGLAGPDSASSALAVLAKRYEGPKLLLLSPRSNELRAEAMRQRGYHLIDYPGSRRKLELCFRSLFSRRAANTIVSTLSSSRTAKRWPQFSELRVLAAEDNPVNQKVLEGMLRLLGVEPQFAANGRIALDQVQESERPFDLILMDCEMPVMDGFSSTREIRAWEAGANSRSRIVALSAHVLQEHQEEARRSGMDDFISKPVALKDLIGALQKCRVSRANAA